VREVFLSLTKNKEKQRKNLSTDYADLKDYYWGVFIQDLHNEQDIFLFLESLPFKLNFSLLNF